MFFYHWRNITYLLTYTTSTFAFSVALTIVKKVLVLENQLYKMAPEININEQTFY